MCEKSNNAQKNHLKNTQRSINVFTHRRRRKFNFDTTSKTARSSTRYSLFNQWMSEKIKRTSSNCDEAWKEFPELITWYLIFQLCFCYLKFSVNWKQTLRKNYFYEVFIITSGPKLCDILKYHFYAANKSPFT